MQKGNKICNANRYVLYILHDLFDDCFDIKRTRKEIYMNWNISLGIVYFYAIL